MTNFDWIYDPPDEEPPYALKCRKCGRFISPASLELCPVVGAEGHLAYAEECYKCSKCGLVTDVKWLYA